MPESQSIQDAIKEAMDESGYADSLQAEFDKITEEEEELTTISEAPAEETVEASTDDDSSEEEATSENPSEETDEEPPLEYWGTSLEGYTAEQRKEIIAALEQRDGEIYKLQQKLAQEPEAPEATTPEAEVELTDDDILRAIGVDPAGDQYEVEYAKKFSLPLAKQIMQLEETVEKISETEQVREVANYWNQSLDSLESKHGKLPGDRVQVLTFAAREGISDPEVLYFRLTAGPKAAIDKEISKYRKDAAKKAAQGTVRPRNTEGGQKVLNTKGKDLRETVREAAIAAQNESGFRWKDVLKGSKS